ncbi:YgaC family protein [Paenibacillus lupini]|uniref:YgaC family protein n=1 Tax=Paenibacillus lupini TaxID=1450204 RepID=UPI00141E5437|nr:putative RNA-binding protein associated with RNAse of E/G family [Paenibacillus lupini]
MTAVINEKREIVHWYFDITLANLDVVVLPNREIFVLDEAELLNALNNEKITDDDYRLAKAELDKLLTTLTADNNDLLKRWEADFKTLHAVI